MKVGIVGCGLVGSTTAYALVMRGIGREIVLVDLNEARAKAEADDIQHAVPFAHPLNVRPGRYPDLADCRVVVLTAGVNQKPGETRLQLLQRNAAVFQAVVPQVIANSPDAVILVATNPVDVMTHLTTRIAVEHGWPESRVLGSGTTLDSARFRTLVGAHCEVDPHYVHGYVVGEHGDSEVLSWSSLRIGGMTLDEFCTVANRPLSDAKRMEIDELVRRAAYHIISAKHATYYGIGSALARIVNVILHDQRAILSVCSRMEEVAGVSDVTLSRPHLVGGNGIIDTLPLPLNKPEAAAFQDSARVVRDAIQSLFPEG